jgi:hypothetical protein
VVWPRRCALVHQHFGAVHRPSWSFCLAGVLTGPEHQPTGFYQVEKETAALLTTSIRCFSSSAVDGSQDCLFAPPPLVPPAEKSPLVPCDHLVS